MTEHTKEQLQQLYTKALTKGETSLPYATWVKVFQQGQTDSTIGAKPKRLTKKAAKIDKAPKSKVTQIGKHPKNPDKSKAKKKPKPSTPVTAAKGSSEPAAVAPKQKRLTAKEEIFCRAYIVHLNGTKAAGEAGYSKTSARDIACENLTKPHIKARIAELQTQAIERLASKEELDLSAEAVLLEVGRLGMANIHDFLVFDPVTKEPYISVKDVPRNKLAGLVSLEMVQMPPVEIMSIGNDGSMGGLEREVLKTKIGLSKMPALRALMQHHKLLDGDTLNVKIQDIDKLINVLRGRIDRKKAETQAKNA